MGPSRPPNFIIVFCFICMFIGSVVEILLLAGFHRDGKTWKSLTIKTDMEKSWNRKNGKKVMEFCDQFCDKCFS